MWSTKHRWSMRGSGSFSWTRDWRYHCGAGGLVSDRLGHGCGMVRRCEALRGIAACWAGNEPPRACAVVPIPLRHHSSNTIAHSAQFVNGGYAVRNWVSHNLVPFLRARGEHVNHTWENDWWVFREYKVQSSPTAREKLYHRLLISNNSSRYELARTPCHLSV